MNERIPLRILLVEDDPGDAQMFRRYASGSELYHIGVEHVITSREALRRLSEEEYDLLFLDQRLGEAVTGLDILKLIRAAGSELPVIVFTGTVHTEIAVEMMKSGATDYLTKDDLNWEILERSIRYALERRRQDSARKRAEKRLRESEARFRALFEGIPEAVLVHDEEGNILHINDVGARRLQWRVEELVGRNLCEIVTPENADSIAHHVREARTQGSCSFETTYVSRTGRHTEAEVNECPIEFEGKSAILSVARDITARKRAEERLRLLASAMEQSTEGLSVSDLGGNPLFVNDALATMHGYTPEELVGKHLSLFHTAEQMPSVEAANRQIQETGEFSGEIWHARRDGTVFPTLVHDSLLRDEAGNPVGMIGTARDITERKALEEQLRQSQKMEAFGRLAGGVAHDFNNLLVVINGYARLILDTLEAGSLMRREVEEIIKAGSRAGDLTHQLLAFGRRQTLQTRTLDPNGIVQPLGEMLRRVIGEDIDLTVTLPGDVGSVEADGSQIEQVLMNLAVNARDAMPNGGKLTIETANVMLNQQYADSHSGVKPGPYVMLAVTDTGSGMDEEMREHIFEPFFTTKEEGKGTGLGLPTVYGIVKQHEGNIWVYSEPGEGTTFKIYLPRVDAEAEGLPAKTDDGLTARGSETILVVEDEQAVLRTVRCMLEEAGYKVLVATCSEEAEEVFTQRSGEVDLFLTDVVMPGCTGRDLYERLASEHPSLKVLYMSGYPHNAIAHQGVLEPGTNFVQKPFTPDTLAGKVREVLDQ